MRVGCIYGDNASIGRYAFQVVVALGYQSAAVRSRLALRLGGIEAVLLLQHLVGHLALVVDHLVFSDIVDGGHVVRRWGGTGASGIEGSPVDKDPDIAETILSLVR